MSVSYKHWRIFWQVHSLFVEVNAVVVLSPCVTATTVMLAMLADTAVTV